MQQKPVTHIQQKFFQKPFVGSDAPLNAELAAGWLVIPETFKITPGIIIRSKNGDAKVTPITVICCVLQRECPAE